MTVLVAGGGIAGIAMALTCHQIGVPVKVFESANQILPLGVGINLQPNAVRELYDLGLSASLNQIGIQTREWALVGRNGNDIWAEPRGLLAGYDWPAIFGPQRQAANDDVSRSAKEVGTQRNNY